MSGRIVYYYERTLTLAGQRHRAYRIAVAAWLRRGEDLLPARREHQPGDRPGHRRLADGAEAAAARHHAAVRADCSTPPACRSCSSRSPASRFRSRRCSISGRTSSARNSRPSRAPRSRRRTAARCGRSRSISTSTSCSPTGCRRRTWSSALAAQNLITPVGTEKIGKFEYIVDLNDAPKAIAELNDLPIKRANGTIVYIRDVAFVHDGNPPQTNVVRVDGSHAVLMTILKVGSALDARHHQRRQGAAAEDQGVAAEKPATERRRRPVGVRQRARSRA